MTGPLWTVLATALVAAITLVGTIYTQRAARSIASTSAQAAVVSSREAAEQDAYDRARRTLEATIDRQDAEIEEQRREIDQLKTEQKATREDLRTTRADLAETRLDLAQTRADLTETRKELKTTRTVLRTTEENLAAAERLLQSHYPDEE